MRIITICLIFIGQLYFSKNIKAVYLDINIYHAFEVKAIDYTIIAGKYTLEADNKIIKDFIKNNKLSFSVKNDSVLVESNKKKVGVFKNISLNGKGFLNVFSLINAQKALPKRIYDDHLKVAVIDGKLQLINNVELEHYVAGVVQSEGGGSSKDIQFFFVQAISCRTYALVNYLKHSVDGYNLCDEVHCQYYLGRCINSDITRAVARTSGEVIVDSNNRMISAAFHSNCGGETVNSEDIWTLPTSYLKSRKDSFCTSMTKSKWEKPISQEEFLSKLSSAFNFPVSNTVKVDSALNFKQKNRQTTFVNNIPLKLIRKEFGLRSTFFDIVSDGSTVIIKGRGFGHGVGLCQQGSIRMVELGYDYHEIIPYYYKGTKTIHFSELKYNFMPQF